ncbi:general transcription factor II-I repeat domain-containing protein 2A-like [Diorhabda sublineata]|uniref:general transcription factor II-I repeat domain-containing protein 2A-like n=1 Tax=Diorhabda sublineata TaxID=1163346 RepID=UPI0024E0584F|nr:general transcription factor II-I repeat domain-containing protein 2A-like [Diorhabda sublineata]
MGNKDIRILCYGDDAVLIAENEDGLQRLLFKFNTTAKSLKMKISAAKIKCMITSKTPIRCKLVVDDEIIQQEMKFKYPGPDISGSGDIGVEETKRTEELRRTCKIDNVNEWILERKRKWNERMVKIARALDESTDLSDTAQLAIFIRGIDKEFTVTEELLSLQPLKATTTGEDIFNEVQKVFTNFGLPWSKLNGVCTDGAPSMVVLRKGFIGILNEKATELNVQKDDLIVLHCIIHQQNLCSKSIRLHNVMNVVVKTINFIRSRGLNHRQFKTFLDEISAEYNDVTYYCGIRWMSKGKMLKRFYELRNEIADFIKIKDKPLSELSDPKWICDLAFLVDLTGYLNDLNLKLQKQGQLVNDLDNHLKAFQIKLRLWE